MYVEIGKIYHHINRSSEGSWLEKISTRLAELEFESDHLIKPKCWKSVVKNIAIIIKHANLAITKHVTLFEVQKRYIKCRSKSNKNKQW